MKKVGDNHFGSWAGYLNTYSLAMTESIYKNQREESDRQRVYILTRSAFAGQQRAAATPLSGDIGASWEVYRKQIAAGINFSMAGIPYWNDRAKRLTIADRAGRFPGMLESRTFNVVLVGKTTAPASTSKSTPTRSSNIPASK